MADLNSVKVVEVCKVAPRPSTPDSSAIPESLPLTLFDLLWLRFAPVQRLFFYEINNPNSSDTNFTHSTLIPKLKTSLSLTLQQFLPLAGNVIWPKESPKPILRYVRGDGVFLTIAESDNDFHHIVSSNSFNIEAKEYHPLIPQMPVSHEKAAAIALQITIFPNRGFCIGTSMHHAILDGKTSTMFVKTWAHICKHEDSNLLPEQLKPFFDRSVIKDPANLEEIYANQFRNMDRPDNRSLMFSKFKVLAPGSIRDTFMFTRANIEALRQLVKEKKQQHGHQSVQHLSTFCLTCAYIWICLIKAEEMQAKNAVMGFTVDARSRLDPPIPTNYVGNCLVLRLAVAETKALLGGEGLVVAVDAISEAVKSLDDGPLNGAEDWIPLLYSVGTDESVFSTAGSPRFEIYDTDFGWGRPKKVEIVSIEGTGAMSISESKDGAGGLDIGLVMKKHHMEIFASLFAKGLENL